MCVCDWLIFNGFEISNLVLSFIIPFTVAPILLAEAADLHALAGRSLLLLAEHDGEDGGYHGVVDSSSSHGMARWTSCENKCIVSISAYAIHMVTLKSCGSNRTYNWINLNKKMDGTLHLRMRRTTWSKRIVLRRMSGKFKNVKEMLKVDTGKVELCCTA